MDRWDEEALCTCNVNVGDNVGCICVCGGVQCAPVRPTGRPWGPAAFISSLIMLIIIIIVSTAPPPITAHRRRRRHRHYHAHRARRHPSSSPSSASRIPAHRRSNPSCCPSSWAYEAALPAAPCSSLHMDTSPSSRLVSESGKSINILLQSPAPAPHKKKDNSLGTNTTASHPHSSSHPRCQTRRSN